jgi:hypothetical protein
MCKPQFDLHSDGNSSQLTNCPPPTAAKNRNPRPRPIPHPPTTRDMLPQAPPTPNPRKTRLKGHAILAWLRPRPDTIPRPTNSDTSRPVNAPSSHVAVRPHDRPISIYFLGNYLRKTRAPAPRCKILDFPPQSRNIRQRIRTRTKPTRTDPASTVAAACSTPTPRRHTSIYFALSVRDARCRERGSPVA